MPSPVLLLGLLVLLACARLYLRQGSLIFRPGPAVSGSPADLGLRFEDLGLRCADGVMIQGWWVPGRMESKSVVFFHGSDGNITHELATLRFLHGLGPNVLMVDYPGYGRSDARTSERGCYQAAEAAWSFVTESRGFHGEDVIVFGQSLGSAVATYLATTRTCGGLVFQSGFSSVPDMAAAIYWYLPVRFFVHTRMDSLRRIAGCHCPVLVLHSEDDEHIPVAQAFRVYAQAPGPKKFVRLGGPHSSTQWRRDPDVRAAWTELLAGRTEQWPGALPHRDGGPPPAAGRLPGDAQEGTGALARGGAGRQGPHAPDS
ncbi:MAG TPA: alpha/beta hydrolase [Chloroflexi bacterium]|nr:alpha/beta hydrolase [Chloroflexota bacterium]